MKFHRLTLGFLPGYGSQRACVALVARVCGIVTSEEIWEEQSSPDVFKCVHAVIPAAMFDFLVEHEEIKNAQMCSWLTHDLTFSPEFAGFVRKGDEWYFKIEEFELGKVINRELAMTMTGSDFVIDNGKGHSERMTKWPLYEHVKTYSQLTEEETISLFSIGSYRKKEPVLT